MKNLILFILIFPLMLIAQPKTWESRGVGGGGALFSPSINPNNDNEFYVSCDMSEIYHTKDFGQNYDLLSFKKYNGGRYSKVCFTNVPNTQYSINYKMNGYADNIVPVKTTDNGVTWTELPGNPLPTDPPYGIYVDYNNPNRVILSYYASFYISNDGGLNFTQIHETLNMDAGVVVGGVFFDYLNIYIGTSEGIFYSSDGGTTFNEVTTHGLPTGEAIWSFAASKYAGKTRLFCITGNSPYVGMSGSDYWGFMKGVYLMEWGSATWVKKMNGIDATDYPMYVAMADNDINTVYLFGSNGTQEPTVIKSQNGGDNWAHTFIARNNDGITTGWSGDGGDRGWSYGECIFGFDVCRNNARKVLITDFGFIHKTTDGGTTWQQSYLSVNDQNPPGMKITPGKSYHSIGMENTTCWQMFWVDQNKIFGCFSDIRGIVSTDAGDSWSFNYSGTNANTIYRMMEHSNGSIYAATSNIHDMYQSTRLADNILDVNDPNGKIIYSSDKGKTWKDVKLFSHPVFWLAVNPNDSNKMYASVIHSSSGGIYQTSNLQNGATAQWTKLPNPPRTEGHPATIIVLKDNSVVCTYSGHRTNKGFTASSGCFILNPQTNTWTDVSDPGMKYWCKDLVVDPNDPQQNTWYVCVFSGWGNESAGKGGLYKTTDRGKNWIRINNQDRVTSITFNPLNKDEIYMTTEVEGLWICKNINDANPVFTLVDSYSFRQPERVFFNPYDPGELWVTSFGNGIKVGRLEGVVTLGVPQLLIPVDKAVNVSKNPLLNWKKANNASSYVYQISEKLDFSAILQTNEVSDTSVNVSGLKENTLYYWRVKSKNTTNESVYSAVFSFTTAGTSNLEAPILLSPADKSTNEPTTLVLNWNSVVNATGYSLEVATDSIFAKTVLIKNNINDTFNLSSNLKELTTYFWRVKAGNSNQQSNWSKAFSFTTGKKDDVEEGILHSSLLLYPNPSAGELKIDFYLNEDSYVDVYLFDILGKEIGNVYKSSLKYGQNSLEISDLSMLQPGMYLVKIETKKSVFYKQLFIK